MKTENYYICEDCGTKYRTADEALKCEDNHAKIKTNTRIIKYVYLRRYEGENSIPYRLIIDLGDGIKRDYLLLAEEPKEVSSND